MLISAEPDEGRRPPWRVILPCVGAIALALLGIVQIIVPPIAEQRVRSKLADAGIVADVEIKGPAIKLLFGRADLAAVSARSAAVSPDQLADLVAQTGSFEQLDLFMPRLRTRKILFTDVRLRKRGERLVAQASATGQALGEALPPGSELRSVRSGSDGVIFDGSVTALGTTVSGPAELRASRGTLVLTTPALPLIGSASFAAFSDPRVRIDAISVRPSDGRNRFRVSGQLASDD